MDGATPLLGLFLAALAAGSALPFPSEPALLLVLAGGTDPWLAVLVATLGNVLGALTVWLIGRALARGGAGWLGPRLAARRGGAEAAREAARARLRRWGAGLLLLAWAPWIGDAIVLGAGLVGVRALPFLLLVSAGKLARYAALAWAVSAV